MPINVVSVHIPKTAGTSLTSALWEHFGSSLHIDVYHDPCNPDDNLSETAELPPGIRCVHGHFRGDRYADNTDAYHLTFLRNPVQNLISIYFFWKVWPGPGGKIYDRFRAEKPSIVEFARSYPFANFLTKLFFSGVDMGRFQFVGSYEHRGHGLNILSKELGISIDVHRRDNVTSEFAEERLDVENNAAIVGELKSIVKEDMKFYRKMVRLDSYVNTGRIW